MTTPNVGDRVRYTGQHWVNTSRDFLNNSHIGATGTVTAVYFNTDSVAVTWDERPSYTKPARLVYSNNVEVVQDTANEGKPEDPRTPEAKYIDNVDNLLTKYAERLRDSNDTMVYPYSHLGLLAEFLRDYRAIDRPDTLT